MSVKKGGPGCRLLSQEAKERHGTLFRGTKMEREIEKVLRGRGVGKWFCPDCGVWMWLREEDEAFCWQCGGDVVSEEELGGRDEGDREEGNG